MIRDLANPLAPSFVQRGGGEGARGQGIIKGGPFKRKRTSKIFKRRENRNRNNGAFQKIKSRL